MAKLRWYHKKDAFTPADIVTRKTCPLCGSKEREAIEALPKPWDDVAWQRCWCGFIYQDPMPSMDAMKRYYATDYRLDGIGKKDYPTPHGQAAIVLRANRQLVAFGQADPKPPKRVLDIGCANGILLEKFRITYGAEVMGVEYGLRDHEILGRREIPFEDDISKVTGKFDLITMSHVLEHIDEPIEYLTMLKEKLAAPKANLLIEIPTPASASAYSNFHAVIFPEEPLLRTLALSGWVPKYMTFPEKTLMISVARLP